MRPTPEQVLAILAQRMEKRADALEAVTMVEYRMAKLELRRFAAMVRKAREYLISVTKPD